jgi:sarcosine oxidase subunit beta
MEGPKVVVIGGGAVGAACAYHLALKGTRVTLVEKDSPASASSGRSAGIVETQYVNEFEVRMTALSMPLFEELAARRGVPFKRCGYLRLAHTPEQASVLSRSLQLQAEFGITHARIVSPDEIAQLVPGMRTNDIEAGLWGPEDGRVDPAIYVSQLLEEARNLGLRVLTRTRVQEISVEGGRVRGVRANGTFLEADAVVNAAGAWARQIGAMVGLDVPVDGYRRQVVVLRPNRPLERLPVVMDYIPGFEREGLYFCEETGGLVLASLHWESVGTGEQPEDPDNYREKPDPDFVEKVVAALADRWPPAEGFQITGGWAGLYPMTPDGLPILGEAEKVRGFYNAVGFDGVGIQQSPAAGRAIAELIVEGRTEVLPDLSPFRLERFSRA